MSIEQRVENYRLHFREKRLAKPGRCQACNRHGRLRWHGSYERTLITTVKTYTLRIMRLLCVLCGHTFSLLPDFVAKFHRYAKEAIRLALRMLKSNTYGAVASWFIEHGVVKNMATLTIHLWRRRFV